MAELINAKCPNCGATLELPSKLDRAFCIHCGGKVIIAKDVHYHESKPAIACPECKGKGIVPCQGGKLIKVKVKDNNIYSSGCNNGDGNCNAIAENDIPRSYRENLAIDFVDIYQEDSGIQYNKKRTCSGGGCSVCYSTGIIKRLFSQRKCDYCGGTGKCIICKGIGKCQYCNGTGKVKCKDCNGTGIKVYQGE